MHSWHLLVTWLKEGILLSIIFQLFFGSLPASSSFKRGCGIFRISFFYARFMFIMSFLKITRQSYVSFLPSYIIFDSRLVDYPLLVTSPRNGTIFFHPTIACWWLSLLTFVCNFQNLGIMSGNSSPHIREDPVANLHCINH